jgi:acyl carrier protein
MASADEVREWLTARMAAVFGVPGDRLNGRTAFDDLGMDSITRAGLAREIEERFRVSLDPEALYEFTTIDDLASHVARR